MALRFGGLICTVAACACVPTSQVSHATACSPALQQLRARNIVPSDATDQRSDVEADATGRAITGTASMYNPYQPSGRAAAIEGGTETASGERYDPDTWTAAIRTDLRHAVGGVSFGKNYQAAYVLVESIGKRAIIRINDVGPLRPGRIIDFNEQTMRYFDPTLELGLIRAVTVKPLPGTDWPLGPVDSC